MVAHKRRYGRWTTTDAACDKTGYRTERDARLAMRWMRGKGEKRILPYICPDCHQWHLGHSGRALR